LIESGFRGRRFSDSCFAPVEAAQMARPYSIDLRNRAMARVAAGETIRVVAAALRISPASVSKWTQRLRRTGDVAPGRMGGHKPRSIRAAQADWLRARTASSPFTLRGLVEELARRGLKVDYRTVWSFVHDEKLSFKKNDGGERAGSP
jgi:putative transposase